MQLRSLLGAILLASYAPSPAIAQTVEMVLVEKVVDDNAIVVRTNGASFMIEKGVGCLSLSRYEGKRVAINSPGLFLGVGSKLMIPELGQECRIWNSTPLATSTPQRGTPSPPSTTDREAAADTCYESIIVSPRPFKGNNGEIFRLDDGSVWEIKYEYEYLYEYSPSVIICPATGKLLVARKSLNVQRVAAASTPTNTGSAAAESPAVIETRIEGEFSGWDGETIFKLQNGQIWQQSSGGYKYKYAYGPKVLIYKSGSTYRLRVDGVDGEIAVTRIK